MKKNCTVILSSAFVCLLITGCSKEAAGTSKSEISNPALDKAVSPDIAISNASAPASFLGIYTVRDEKTVFIGQANPRGTNVLINLSYLDVQKPITLTADKKHLTMPYGPSNYVDSGWAYIIDYNNTTKALTLSPNKAMQKDIVAGSFETLVASYNPSTKEGSFTTRFTASKDNGNESQVSEGFWKE